MKFALFRAGICVNVQESSDPSYIPEPGSIEIPSSCDIQPGEAVALFDTTNGWTRHAAPVVPLGILLEDLCAQIEAQKDTIMYRGFSFQGQRIQADIEAMVQLAGLVLGQLMDTPFIPTDWRKADNQFLHILDQATLYALAGGFAVFRKQAYQDIFDAKDSIRRSTTAEIAQGHYQAWQSKVAAY